MEVQLFMFPSLPEGSESGAHLAAGKQLRSSIGFRFVPSLWFDLDLGTAVLAIGLSPVIEHVWLLCELENKIHSLGRRLYPVETGSSNGSKRICTNGGGSVRVEGDTLIFFGSSHGLGKYNKELLLLVESELCEKFGTEKVEFRD